MKIVIAILLTLLGGCASSKVEPVSMPKVVQGIETGEGFVSGEVKSLLIEVNPLSFIYKVNNQTEKEIKLNFSSSQRFDYLVEKTSGEDVFLFSSISSFLQVIGKEKLRPGGELSYEINLQDLDLVRGDYRLAAWLTPTSGEAYKTRISFSVK